MDYEQSYFFISTGPNWLDYDKLNMIKNSDGTYVNNETGDKYIERPMYDFGYGRFDGLQKLPKLSFAELIKLIDYYATSDNSSITWKIFMNMVGSVVVIMEDHLDEFIGFLREKIKSDYFRHEGIRIMFTWFGINKVENRVIGSVGNKSYRQILDSKEEFRKISGKLEKMLFLPSVIINEKYFYVYKKKKILSAHQLGLSFNILTGKYINKQRKQKWKKFRFSKLGITGYEKLPESDFRQLMDILLFSDFDYSTISKEQMEFNINGAMIFLLKRHIEEFISFMKSNVDKPEFWENKIAKRNLHFLFFEKNNHSESGSSEKNRL